MNDTLDKVEQGWQSGAFSSYWEPYARRQAAKKFYDKMSPRERLAYRMRHLRDGDDLGAWTVSGGFGAFFTDYFNNTNAFWTPALPNLNLETHKVALFANAVTPAFDATALLATYNGTSSTWSAANESTGTGYTAGGSLLLNTAVTEVTGAITMWDADDTAWTTITVTAYGCLVYADSVTAPANNVDQAIIAVYFGGAFQTTAGNFTIQWASTGLYRDDN